jgi:hypothetical protein
MQKTPAQYEPEPNSQPQINIQNHYDSSTHFYPSVGQVETQRFTMDN